MLIRTKFRTHQGAVPLYALGSTELVKRAADNVFLQLGWTAKWNKHSVLMHYPGGWVDRAGSAYTRASSMPLSDNYGTDAISIALHETNNPDVQLL